MKILRQISFVFLFLLASCASNSEATVGILCSATGKYSSLLITARNGAILAAEEGAGKDGFTINLEIADDESSETVALEKIRAFHEKGVDIVICSTTSAVMSAVLPYFNEHGMLAFSPTASSAVFDGLDDSLIRLTTSVKDYAKKTAEFAVSKGLSTIVAIADDNNASYSQTFIDSFIAGLGEKAATIQFTEKRFHALENPRYKEIASEILDLKTEGVVIIASPLDTAMICQNLAGRNYVLMSAPWCVSDELIKNGGKAIEGLFCYTINTQATAGSPLESFQKRYEERFGTQPTYQAQKNYDTVKLLSEILKSRRKATPETVKAAIIAKRTFDGIEAPFQIDEFGDCSLRLYLNTIQNARWVRLE